jgi:hypothetical protein
MISVRLLILYDPPVRCDVGTFYGPEANNDNEAGGY